MAITTTSKAVMFWLAVTYIGAAASAVVPSGSEVETQDLGGCLFSLTSVEGCVEAIHVAVSNKTYDELKHQCCVAINLLGDYCWPIIFPNHPYVPLFLKAVCKVLGNAAKVETAAAPPN
ncbi:hypothetical protein F3Y22_tig00109991pilonHSYRG00037 [Hibiscus syriacus]|uniref:Prolamin-like domain-containing protein n=1 Tax=Hibiscus syriacus TaxID=106335 RepID=A0A6A3BS58_HIBSY|nr:uncharacterized protein LOC120212022 [Hibiscus syriacus]KAE8718761.1 hypothetical protein F3Y22_tig00109991pilonHSYRG00037 [Hibiscus syriacus]